MPFRFRDETAGQDLIYIDNAGQLGLGSLPNSGQQITVRGIGVLDPAARFANGMLIPGAQSAYEGTIFVPGNGSASVSITVGQIPTVTASSLSSGATTSQVTFSNGASGAQTVRYGIW
jgi:hypothetical protein